MQFLLPMTVPVALLLKAYPIRGLAALFQALCSLVDACFDGSFFVRTA